MTERQANKPAPLRPCEQKVRNELRKQEDFDQHVDQGLSQRVPGAGNKYDNAARSLRGNQDQPQIRKQSKSRWSLACAQCESGAQFPLQNIRDARGLVPLVTRPNSR